MNDVATIGHNQPNATSEAAELAAAFDRAPDPLDADSAPTAVLLAKQMRLCMDAVDTDRKAAIEPLREEIQHIEVPYKDAYDKLDVVRAVLLSRLGNYMQENGVEKVQSDYGPSARLQDATTFEVENIKRVPKRFLKLEVDKAAIKKALKAGEEIPGIQAIKIAKAVVA